MSSNNVSAEQLQQQMLVMQQQFTASQQAMTAEMQQMVQENQRLRAAAAAAASSGSSSSSSSSQPTVTVPVPRIGMRLMQPSSFHGHTSSNATQWLMEVERYFMASNMVFRLAGVIAHENTVRVDVLEGFGVGV
ncbi:hypothetical protein COLO4_10196, partial [Corchorus olitorius]